MTCTQVASLLSDWFEAWWLRASTDYQSESLNRSWSLQYWHWPRRFPQSRVSRWLRSHESTAACARSLLAAPKSTSCLSTLLHWTPIPVPWAKLRPNMAVVSVCWRLLKRHSMFVWLLKLCDDDRAYMEMRKDHQKTSSQFLRFSRWTGSTLARRRASDWPPSHEGNGSPVPVVCVSKVTTRRDSMNRNMYLPINCIVPGF